MGWGEAPNTAAHTTQRQKGKKGMGWGETPHSNLTQPWQGVGVKFATFWDTPETHTQQELARGCRGTKLCVLQGFKNAQQRFWGFRV